MIVCETHAVRRASTHRVLAAEEEAELLSAVAGPGKRHHGEHRTQSLVRVHRHVVPGVARCTGETHQLNQ